MEKTTLGRLKDLHAEVWGGDQNDKTEMELVIDVLESLINMIEEAKDHYHTIG